MTKRASKPKTYHSDVPSGVSKAAEKDAAALAELIAREACQEGIPLSQRLDALKALTAYHVGVAKAAKGKKEDDEKGMFQALKEKIHGR